MIIDMDIIEIESTQNSYLENFQNKERTSKSR